MTIHPCGSLPVTGITVSAWFCHHHMAWWAQVTRYTQTGDQDLTVDLSHSEQFGPFDGEDEVRAYIDLLVRAAVVTPA